MVPTQFDQVRFGLEGQFGNATAATGLNISNAQINAPSVRKRAMIPSTPQYMLLEVTITRDCQLGKHFLVETT